MRVQARTHLACHFTSEHRGVIKSAWGGAWSKQWHLGKSAWHGRTPHPRHKLNVKGQQRARLATQGVLSQVHSRKLRDGIACVPGVGTRSEQGKALCQVVLPIQL